MLIFSLLFCINAVFGKDIQNQEPSLLKDKGLIKVKGWPKNKFAHFKVNNKIRIFLTNYQNNTIHALDDGSTLALPFNKNIKSDIF